MPKKYKVIIRPEAEIELTQIFHFIAADKLSAARSFTKAIKGKIRGLQVFPYRGTTCMLKDEDDTTRFINHKGYLIFYEIREKEVIVLHIISPGQDWASFLL